jgi:hypothetical protein
MTIPNYYKCGSCHEKLDFKVRAACYYIGTSAFEKGVAEAELLAIPVRPGWCKDCEALCLVEDIAPLRVFEDAYGAVRCGREIEYPVFGEFWDQAGLQANVANFLRWRMERIHPARALCCGRSNYQLLDVATPLLMHEGCENGFIEPQYLIASYCGPGPGVYSAANYPVYDTEGVLIGRLTWRHRDARSWAVETARFDPIIEV